ncbi:MAG: hypothetical protein JRE47_09815 [Deltaproteobacteria bacterium]|nr:hypothetical protein [Deltaproteobacteria bacterium]
MLHRYINQFVEYCQLANFSVRSIQASDIRLNEFKAFLKFQRIQSVKKITYLHLIDFVADYKDPSIRYSPLSRQKTGFFKVYFLS